ncbi:unnamed protein product [Closterium sp. Yama58-4]|nr:unnamed protein product [Closterium sp. Yama58-4]
MAAGGGDDESIADGSSFEIKIKTLDNRTFDVAVHPEMLVSTLKDRIAPLLGVPAGRQRLVFRGKVLKDDSPVASYGRLGYPSRPHYTAVKRAAIQAAAGVPREDGMPGAATLHMGSVNIHTDGSPMMPDLNQIVTGVLSSIGLNPLAGNTSATINVTQPGGTAGRATGGGSAGAAAGRGGAGGGTAGGGTGGTGGGAEGGAGGRGGDGAGRAQGGPEFQIHVDTAEREQARRQALAPLPRLAANIRRLESILRGSASSQLLNLASRLEGVASVRDAAEWAAAREVVEGVGHTLQQMGPLLLELGRLCHAVQMGDTVGEARLQASQPVFINQFGPNPVVMQVGLRC